MPKNSEGVFYVSAQFPFTFSCRFYGFIRSLHHCPRPRRLGGGPCTSVEAQEMVLWILDRELGGRGRGRGRWVPTEPPGTPRTAGVSPRESSGALISLQPSRIPRAPPAAPQRLGPGCQGVAPRPEKPQHRCAVQVHQCQFCTSRRKGGSAYLRFAAPRLTKAPQARLYTQVPPPCPLPPAPGAVPGVPGLRASPPSHPHRHPEAPGPCLRLEQLPGERTGLLGLPLGGQAPLRVFAPRRDAAGRVILLLFTAFFLHLELK